MLLIVQILQVVKNCTLIWQLNFQPTESDGPRMVKRVWCSWTTQPWEIVESDQMHQIHTGRTWQYLAHSVQLTAESSHRPGLTPLTTSNITLELNLVNVASVTVVKLPGTPYPTVLSLPLTPTDLYTIYKLIYCTLRSNIFSASPTVCKPCFTNLYLYLTGVSRERL